MKDITIKASTIKRELVVFAVCWLVCELLNVYAIATMDGKWSEAVMSIGFVTVAAVVLYAAALTVRLIIKAAKCLAAKASNR